MDREGHLGAGRYSLPDREENLVKTLAFSLEAEVSLSLPGVSGNVLPDLTAFRVLGNVYQLGHSCIPAVFTG